jgi:hypothetical protein
LSPGNEGGRRQLGDEFGSGNSFCICRPWISICKDTVSDNQTFALFSEIKVKETNADLIFKRPFKKEDGVSIFASFKSILETEKCVFLPPPSPSIHLVAGEDYIRTGRNMSKYPLPAFRGHH